MCTFNLGLRRAGAAKIGLAHSLRMSFTAKDQLSAGQAIA